MTDFGRGAIGIPCREQGRWTKFWPCVHRLQLPPDMLPEPIVHYNNSVAQARNEIALKALEQGADWIFWLDDDMLFPADVLMKLIRHPEAIVIGLTLLRCTHDGQFRPIWADRPVEHRDGKVIWAAVDEIRTGPNGLMPILSGTGGGVLTRRAVFETMAAPWWQMGQYDPEMFFEDIYFYDRAREAGFSIWGDPSVRFGHYNPLVMWPHQRADGSWSTVFANGFEGFLEQSWAAPNPAALANRVGERPSSSKSLRDPLARDIDGERPVRETERAALMGD